MALNENELAQQGSTVGPNKRARFDTIQPRTVAAITGAPKLAQLTPMARNTSTGHWVVWTNGGANGTGTISAFIADPDGHQSNASDETLAQMVLGGQIHHDDIPLPSGETQNNLTAALSTGNLRGAGFTITGVAGVA